MPSPRRVYVNNTAIFVTTRTEEGLPLVPTNFMNMIIWSALAKAQALYTDVAVCAFTFLLNHFHMLLVVEDPEQVSRFVGYVKQEIAHAINRLLNRRQRTIWKSEYDAPIILDSDKLIAVLRYIYANPVEAGLESSADNYPGVSSWKMLKNERVFRWCEVISRDSISLITSPTRPDLVDRSQSDYFRSVSKLSLRFDLKPFAWKKCFPDTEATPDSKLRSVVVECVRARELELAEERRKQRVPVMGGGLLRARSMTVKYTPKKFERRMICLSSSKELRLVYLDFYRTLCAQAKQVYARWKAFDFSEDYPAGLIPPAFVPKVDIWQIGSMFEVEDRLPSRVFCI